MIGVFIILVFQDLYVYEYDSYLMILVIFPNMLAKLILYVIVQI